MRLFTRLIVCAAAAILLSAVLFQFADACFGENANVLCAGRQIVLEARRSQALIARSEMVARSLKIKREIIAELIAGRLKLCQAITKFQMANELIENVDLDLIPGYRTPGTPEGVGRQVFIWARNAIAAWPEDKSQRLLAGIENEFHTLFSGSKLVEEYEVRPLDTTPSGRTSEAHSAVW